jgi:hypothetical protein
MVYFWLGRYCTNQLISLSEFQVIYARNYIENNYRTGVWNSFGIEGHIRYPRAITCTFMLKNVDQKDKNYDLKVIFMIKQWYFFMFECNSSCLDNFNCRSRALFIQVLAGRIWPECRTLPRPELVETCICTILARFTFSPSQIESFLQCPCKFYSVRRLIGSLRANIKVITITEWFN